MKRESSVHQAIEHWEHTMQHCYSSGETLLSGMTAEVEILCLLLPGRPVSWHLLIVWAGIRPLRVLFDAIKHCGPAFLHLQCPNPNLGVQPGGTSLPTSLRTAFENPRGFSGSFQRILTGCRGEQNDLEDLGDAVGVVVFLTDDTDEPLTLSRNA